MTHDQFIEKLSATTAYSPERSAELSAMLTETICDYCSDLDQVAIPGFGNFTPVRTDERIDIDRSTGRRVILPPEINVVFKTSVVLRKRIVG